MTRKRKSLFTQKKKVDKNVDKVTPDGLSERKFSALSHAYGSFVGEPQLGHGEDVSRKIHEQLKTLNTNSICSLQEMCMPHYLCLFI